jgi:hypothetical protein
MCIDTMTLELKEKEESKQEEEELDFGATFDTEDAKDEDFDLNLDSARFQGSKGQAGTRTRSGN